MDFLSRVERLLETYFGENSPLVKAIRGVASDEQPPSEDDIKYKAQDGTEVVIEQYNVPYTHNLPPVFLRFTNFYSLNNGESMVLFNNILLRSGDYLVVSAGKDESYLPYKKGVYSPEEFDAQFTEVIK